MTTQVFSPTRMVVELVFLNAMHGEGFQSCETNKKCSAHLIRTLMGKVSSQISALDEKETADVKQQRTKGQKNEENKENNRFVGRFSFVMCTDSSTLRRSLYFQ